MSAPPELDGVVTEPLSAVLGLDRHISTIGIVLGLVGGVALHVGAAAKGLSTPFWVEDFSTSVSRAIDRASVDEIDIVAEAPKPEPPAPEPEAPEPEPTPEPAPPPPDAPPPPAAAAPAQAAQAGQVLAAAPAADDSVEDMTSFTLVQGEGDRFAGGTTASKGTSQQAVRNPVASSDGVKGGTGKLPNAKPPPPVPQVNKARAAAARGTNWSSCGFPAQADMEQIDFARVRLSVTVSPQGKATAVQVLSDPGNGFGSLARQCAFRMTYRAALGPDGQPTTASTPPFTVTFTR